MKVPKLEDALRCECCGIIIGNYRVRNKVIKTIYQYPVIYNYQNVDHIVDYDCAYQILHRQITPRFDALTDPCIYETL